MRIGLDSNVLGYAEGVGDAIRQGQAIAAISAIPTEAVVIPVQALGELFSILTRKAGMASQAAHSALSSWHVYAVAETSADVFQTAAALAATHDLQIWDAVILAACAAAQCEIVLSEDMQHGFTWNGMTIVNPFTQSGAAMLAHALADQR